MLLRWGPAEEETVWGMNGVMEEEVFCLRCAEPECLGEAAVWVWSSGEVTPEIPVWKSSARWLAGSISAHAQPSVGLQPGQVSLRSPVLPVSPARRLETA